MGRRKFSMEKSLFQRRGKQEEGDTSRNISLKKKKREADEQHRFFFQQKGDCKNGNKFCFLFEKREYVKRATT